jgi:type II secretory ATPase GspE/PulE/Tfp pilus assembly ATPase PilB-like protein
MARGIDQQQWDLLISEWVSWRGTGKESNGEICSHCGGTGFKWRTWLFELMDYNDDIRDMLIKGKTAFEVEKFALKNWMINLERDGLFKSMKGYIPLSEIYRVVTHK